MKEQQLKQFLDIMVERATVPHDVPYMACICGMWAHILGHPKLKNPFSKYSQNLQLWWNTGWDASFDAVKMKLSGKG